MAEKITPPPEKQQEEYVANEWRCFSCGHPVIWENDFMRSEVGLVEEGDEKHDSVVGLWYCPHCHIHYEVQWPSEAELEELENNQNNDKK